MCAYIRNHRHDWIQLIAILLNAFSLQQKLQPCTGTENDGSERRGNPKAQQESYDKYAYFAHAAHCVPRCSVNEGSPFQWRNQ
jgi:hypothetical protein